MDRMGVTSHRRTKTLRGANRLGVCLSQDCRLSPTPNRGQPRIQIRLAAGTASVRTDTRPPFHDVEAPGKSPVIAPHLIAAILARRLCL